MEDSKDKKLSTPRLCKQGTTENKKNGTKILIIYIYIYIYIYVFRCSKKVVPIYLSKSTRLNIAENYLC